MLILTRRIGESVVIGDGIVVTITGIQGNKVRVGITAPKSVKVHREEVFVRIQREGSVGAVIPLDGSLIYGLKAE